MEDFIATGKIVALVYFFIIYCGVLFWVFRPGNGKKMEEHRYIPFNDE